MKSSAAPRLKIPVWNPLLLVLAALLSLLFNHASAATGATDIDAIYNSWPGTKLTYYVRLPSGAPGAVAPFGNDSNAGTSNSTAFATIQKGLDMAMAQKKLGNAVKLIIGPGTYRPGTANDTYAFALTFNTDLASANSAPLIIEGAGWSSISPGNTGDVIITGSEVWTGTQGPSSISGAGWTNNGNGTWSKPWPYAFGVPSKSTFQGVPDNYGLSDALLRGELVHVNGQTYYCINPPTDYTNTNSVNNSLGNPRIGPSYFSFPANDSTSTNNVNGGRLTTTSEGRFWIRDAVLDFSLNIVTMGSITVRPPDGFDFGAAGNSVEVTTKRGLMQIYLPSVPAQATNIVLRNLTFQHAGSRPAVTVQNQNNLLIEDCRFINSKRSGIVVAPGGKNITLRRIEASGNGVNGAGVSDVTNALLDQCAFNQNARQAEILGYVDWSSGGIKLMDTTDATLLQSEAKNNRGDAGFWWDESNKNGKVVECVSLNNSGIGVYIEANTSVGNNYSRSTSDGVGTEGLADLGTTPTVTVLRSVIADNAAVAGTENFYSTKSGQGFWIKESENAVIDGNLIVNNSIQISTNDASRGEVRNNVIRNNVIAAGTGQRLYAYGNKGSSSITIALKQLLVDSNGNAVLDSDGNKQYVDKTSAPQTLKGSWYALFDSLSDSTNDNLYYYPSQTAFPSRAQRDGTNTSPAPALTLSGWKTADRYDANNALLTDKNVDSRSLVIWDTSYDRSRPLVAVTPLVDSILETNSDTAVFQVTRVAMPETGYASPLTVNYSLRSNTGDAINGTDFQLLSGTVTIPANQRSVNITVTPTADAPSEDNETIALVLGSGSYVVAKTTATVLLLNVPAAPTGLTATVASDTQVNLAWTAVPTATGYTVKRATTSGGPYTTVASGLTTTNHPDSGLSAGTTYYYIVIAANSGAEGAASSEQSATTWTAQQAWRYQYFGTIANTGTAANTADPDADGLTNATEYAAGTDPKVFTPLDPISLSTSTLSYTQTFDILATSGTPFWLNGFTLPGWYGWTGGAAPTTYSAADGSSANANRVLSVGSATVNPTDRALGAQTGGSPAPALYLGLALKNATGATQTALRITYDAEVWRSNGQAGDGYTVQYQIFTAGGGSINAASGWTTVPALAFTNTRNGGAVALNGNSSANRTADIAANLTGLTWANGQELWIRWSDNTALAQIMALDNVRARLLIPATPAGLTATASAAGALTLAWTAGDAAQTGYLLEYRVNGGGSWTTLTPAPASSATSYTHTGLAAGTTYDYRLSATNTYGSSGSVTASATTWTALQAWRANNSLAFDGSGTAANTADPDGDGLNNLLEYALNGTPTNAASAPFPTASLLPSPSSTLQITFHRARPATELTYTVQASSDLVTWTDLATNPGTVGQDVTVTDSPPTGTTRRFMRLKISIP